MHDGIPPMSDKPQGWKGQSERHALASHAIPNKPSSRTKRYARNVKYNVKRGLIKTLRDPAGFLFRPVMELADLRNANSEVFKRLDREHEIKTKLKGMKRPKIVANVNESTKHLKRAEGAARGVDNMLSRAQKSYDAVKLTDGLNTLLYELEMAKNNIAKAAKATPANMTKLKTSLTMFKDDLDLLRDKTEDIIGEMDVEYVGDRVVISPEARQNIKREVNKIARSIGVLDDIYMD